MVKIKIINDVPKRIIDKARMLIHLSKNMNTNWRKISGLTQAKSYKLNNNYRMLVFNETVFIGSHDSYIRTINSLKKRNLGCNYGK
ncbi:hypothetical protein ADMFC3_08810 [Geovibrio sp. ADMFC3]|jgi:hypothetical protein